MEVSIVRGSVEVEIGRRREKAVARGLRKLDPEEDDFRCDKAISTAGVFRCMGGRDLNLKGNGGGW
jgi:hypothetical protein